ncbi:LysR family transcriptional regulator [uncultured Azohydromonas sp.]|jgi:Transcriptional regulator|uniref:LysR family transcriptional regulator n=1 Tax=uncultured Azohydromonas sp. TaxID=487342 RepID=UPI00262229F5|nr:LysR family transcriptional regulator [uncultured Azohydromonas sp.]
MNLSFHLDDLRLFCLAARRASFAATAKELGTSPAFVSKRIAILEKALGVSLFHRASRRVTVTDDGEAVFRAAQQILEGVGRMAEAVASARAEPRGLLRISTGFRLGRRHVAPALSLLARRYPALDIWLEVVDRQVDLIAEDIDLDLRVGEVHEPHLVAHRIAPAWRFLCAAPGYLERMGHPRTLADLAQHECLLLRERDLPFGVWRLNGPDGLETVKVSGTLASNNADIVRVWALDGHGILLASDWDVATHLASGELVRVLPAYSHPADVWGVTPLRSSQSAKVRVCVAFLQEQLTQGPWALGSV